MRPGTGFKKLMIKFGHRL